VLLAYATSREALLHTIKGDANLLPDPEATSLEFFENMDRLKVVQAAGRQTDSIIFNPTIPRGERLALARAIDSESVRDLAFGPGCPEARNRAGTESPVPPGGPLNVLGWGSMDRFALAVRRRLGDRGGDADIEPPTEVVKRLQERHFDLGTTRILVWPPSMAALSWRTGVRGNLIGYSNPAVDAAIDVGDWAAAQAALRDDPPAAFVCTRDRYAVVDARIKNPTLGPYDLLETLPDWEVEQ
jgi:hypothetical protein